MKKIYSKLTRERQPKFQIETAIFQDESQKKYVTKSAICQVGKEHIKDIYDNYLYCAKENVPMYVECQMDGDVLRFPFVTGESYYDALLVTASNRDKEEFYRILGKYKENLVKSSGETSSFVMSDLFLQIFGEAKEQEGIVAASKLNIDLSFDNIIESLDGQTSIIDYEWMFDFLVPIKFVYFRAVKALFVRSQTLLESFITISEVYDFFEISKEDIVVYESMNGAFIDYINEGDRSYDKILTNYVKPSDNHSTVSTDISGQAQVFVDLGKGYSKESCIIAVDVDESRVINLDIELAKDSNIKEVRIDPLDGTTVIKVRKFFGERQGKKESIKIEDVMHNGMCGKDNIWIFETNDPQILIPLDGKEKFDRIAFEFEVLFANLENYQSYMNPYKEKLQVFMQSEEGRLTHLVEEQKIDIAKAGEQIKNCQRENQLLRDKLAYIENTRAFQMLLKKKVDSISLWDDID